MDDYKWVTLKDGRRIKIKTTNAYMNDKIRSEFNLIKNKNKKNRTISQTEKTNKMLKMQEDYKKYEKERDEKIKKLMQDYDNGKINDEEYDKKSLQAMNEYDQKTKDLKFATIYDEKSDTYMVVEKSDIFYDEKKDFVLNNKSTNNNIYTDEERQSIYDYTTSYGPGSYSTVNPYLYGKDVYSDKNKVQQNIINLDNAMKKSQINGEYHLYRSVEPSRIGNGEFESAIKKLNNAYKKGGGKNLNKTILELEKLKGMTIENKNYLSTSTFLDQNYAQRGVTFVINTKPSDRAIDVRSISAYNGGRNNFMSAFSKGSVQTESEILYDRNTDLKIKDVALTDKGIFILCDTEQKRS